MTSIASTAISAVRATARASALGLTLRATASAGALAIAIAAVPAAAQETIEFSIPAQELGTALEAFGRQADVQLVAAEALVAGRRSAAVEGRYTPAAALGRLLAGSGLEFEFANADTVVVRAASGVAPIRPRAEEVDEARVSDRIVVTGTNIEGVAPAGSPLLTFDREGIDRTGLLSTEDFMRTLPQLFTGGVSNLGAGSVPGVQADNIYNGGQALDLRGLGASATLTLLNGRRLSRAGIRANFVDISAIPLSAVERVEVLSDGASSIYGADAISGVVNFVLRDDYDGAETRLSYAAATEGGFDQLRAAQTFGEQWRSGHALVSYEYFRQSKLFADEKEFAAEAIDPQTLAPSQKRHSVLAALSQSLGEQVELDVNALFSERTTSSVVQINSGELALLDTTSEQTLVSPALKLELGDRWSVRAAADYGLTSDAADNGLYDHGALCCGAGDYLTDVEQMSGDVVLDGRPFTLPGGDVGVALGVAYRTEQLNRETVTATSVTTYEADREVWSAFGELSIPIVGEANRAPGVEALTASLSARYDEYDAFGSSFNPKVGLLWKPTGDLSIRGSYGTSFQPPDITVVPGEVVAVQTTLINDPVTNVRDVPALLVVGVKDDIGPETSETYTFGVDHEHDFGAVDTQLSVTYYDISFTDKVGYVTFPAGFSALNMLSIADQLPDGYLTPNPSTAFIQSFLDYPPLYGFQDSFPFLLGRPATLEEMEYLIDQRQTNIAESDTSGVDIQFSAAWDNGFGELFSSVSANYIFDFTQRAGPTTPAIEDYDRLYRPAPLKLGATAGWRGGAWAVSTTINYVDSYANDYSVPASTVDAWTTADLNVAYDFDGVDASGLLRGARVAFSVRNLFESDPPQFELDPSLNPSRLTREFDPGNATPYGRMVSVELSKTW